VRLVAIFCLLSLFAVRGSADIYAPPGPATYVSSQGTFRLTVYPNVQAARSNIGQGKSTEEARALMWEALGSRCRAVLERFDGNAYVKVREVLLANSVGPNDAIVSDSSGAFATFGEWADRSESDVTIYSENGSLVRRLTTSDLLTKDERTRVTPGHWRDSKRTQVDDTKGVLFLPIIVDTQAQTLEPSGVHRWVSIRLSDGALLP
jgi:hypothetical protein